MSPATIPERLRAQLDGWNAHPDSAAVNVRLGDLRELIAGVNALAGAVMGAGQFVNLVARMDHSADDGFAHPDDPDDERCALDRLIAQARDLQTAPLREVLAQALRDLGGSK